ncbi:MAG: tetratricopeptide repeat protein, partial [Vampirovibrionales bacterium]
MLFNYSLVPFTLYLLLQYIARYGCSLAVLLALVVHPLVLATPTNDALSLNKALDQHTQAIKRNPKDAEAYYNRGNTYYKLGDKQGALA